MCMALCLLPLGSPGPGAPGAPYGPPPEGVACARASASSAARSGRLRLASARLARLWFGFRLAPPRLSVALAWISGGFWLRLDFGFVLVWLDLASGSILTGFQVNFGSIDALSLLLLGFWSISSSHMLS